MYTIYSPHWTLIQSFIQSILFLTTPASRWRKKVETAAGKAMRVEDKPFFPCMRGDKPFPAVHMETKAAFPPCCFTACVRWIFCARCVAALGGFSAPVCGCARSEHACGAAWTGHASQGLLCILRGAAFICFHVITATARYCYCSLELFSFPMEI
jgi:hypothetical protein